MQEVCAESIEVGSRFVKLVVSWLTSRYSCSVIVEMESTQ